MRTGDRKSRRKLKAVLAGGLTLGLGATITLAAWNDSEYASGTFTAGSFSIEGSTDGTTYAEHPTAGTAASLAFSTGFDNISPGEVVAAPFAVRLTATTTYDATVTVASATPAPPAFVGLTYGIATVPTFGDCSATPTTPTWIVAEGTALDSVAGAVPFSLTQGTPPTTPGAPAFLCFVVTADSGLVQGTSVTETWQLLAESV
ncbi:MULTISPECIES: SipW-dependent-type signal peptide-containing protein [unclassified Micromonospora]|uniref:SipW-dependent-type signal peptide-containing protein n=1 Tax=unclassified Micromonospora TaxID=2617518 RepID=UPI0022B73321|nr:MULTISPECIES: SipW-dependent-type signal peptide-containing protein [unclassified Micromonospora]MCZ7418629.1 SipW-dependent-type signal peptide-containing protein [Verrucosispora sp. WMMA2121]WBB92335.1 SipW-dependent-type signal peptide-containing protein [Verrucosispora sp. WMMC514]